MLILKKGELNIKIILNLIMHIKNSGLINWKKLNLKYQQKMHKSAVMCNFVIKEFVVLDQLVIINFFIIF